MILAAETTVHAPHIDWAAFSPLVALFAGSILVLLIGLVRARVVREHVVPAATLVVLGATLWLSIWRWEAPEPISPGALRVDNFALFLSFVFIAAAMGAVLLG